jgi:hypothetical protein
LAVITIDKPKIPDAEARAKDIANLRKTGKLLDLWTLELDETIVALDRHLLQQRQARLLSKSNSLSREKSQS